MLFKIKEEQKAFLRVFITYGMHIWLLILVCNIVIFYSIRFFINASTTRTANSDMPVEIIVSPPSVTEIPTPIPTTVGPVIGLSFTLPGIGTNGGNLKPAHPSKDVTIYFYNSDTNIADKTVKPVYLKKILATYDENPNSSTYTYFVNKYIDLGDIDNGNYQIAFQTPQSLLNLIKSPDSRVLGGQIFELFERHFSTLPPQSILTGDIYPYPIHDNKIDINDYNMLVNCFNVQISSEKCENSSIADLDDNGIVDGIDYNILLLNFRSLQSLGLPIPTIATPIKTTPSISPPVNPTQEVNVSQIPVKPASNGSFSGTIIFTLFAIALGIIAFVIYKFHLLNKLFPKKSAEKKISQQSPPVVELAEDRGNDQAVSKTVVTDIIEKTGFLKKVSVDAQANGSWITLADDAGVTRGFYPKTDVTDGFVKIKGTMKNDQDYKPYIYITELETED